MSFSLTKRYVMINGSLINLGNTIFAKVLRDIQEDIGIDIKFFLKKAHDLPYQMSEIVTQYQSQRAVSS